MILDEEASVDHKLNPEVDERSTQGNDVRSAGSNIYSEDSKRQEGADDASVNSSSSLQSHHETRERVLRLLKEENERAVGCLHVSGHPFIFVSKTAGVVFTLLWCRVLLGGY